MKFSLFRLSSEGDKAFDLLNKRSQEEVAEFLGELLEKDQYRLINAMQIIEDLLNEGKEFKYSEPYFLRQHELGDMGLIVHKHGIIYAEEKHNSFGKELIGETWELPL